MLDLPAELGDIDLVRTSLAISERLNGQRRIGGRPGAQHGSEEDVLLADGLDSLLANHIEAQGTTGPDQWLFVGKGAVPLHQSSVGDWWRLALRDAGVAGVTLHDLRHFDASGLIAAGCDIGTVQRAPGTPGQPPPSTPTPTSGR